MRETRNTRQRENLIPGIIQGYHQGIRGEQYAFSGYNRNLYFTSDRYEVLDENFQRIGKKAGKPLKGYGLEIETSCNSINNNTAYATVLRNMLLPLVDNNLFKLQSDSSLHGNSTCEIITQVMTKEAIRNWYPRFAALWNGFKLMDIHPEHASCGMHVNISTALLGADGVKKLYYFINRWYGFSCNLLMRDPGRTGYCSRMHDYENARRLDVHHLPGSHGDCFNGTHYDVGRVEVRLVGGQADFETFRNTMETIFFLVERMKAVTWAQLESPVEVFRGCNQYVLTRLRRCVRHGNLSDAEWQIISETAIEENYNIEAAH